ncbi:hypothetical protein OG875_04565 [Streptomyces sp. NBC_01498]|uniref:hypothetical protein n=1 Tax=Streptomyces sp. NBC_01498 TaxID=2975870 RepID=UPI002E7C3164|nr:hypothetical protein [Streptomyces sp. NBC_01498]WTL23931.1 hypothetical protein OG875_04565 [Streptomyces sp. NBC_01498]
MGWFDEDTRTDAERAWDAYTKASGRLAVAQRELFETDPLPAVRKALAGGDGTGLFAALDLLTQVGWNRPQLVRAVLPELYSCSLSLGRPGIFARLVLGRLSRAGERYTRGMEAEIGALMEATLRDEGDDALALRALGLLLEDIDSPALIARLREFARASSDEDVRELAEEYPEDEHPPPPGG